MDTNGFKETCSLFTKHVRYREVPLYLDENGDVYSAWSDWSVCDTTCKKDRQRFCFKKDIKDCINENRVEKEEQSCSLEECASKSDHYCKVVSDCL